MESFKFHAMDFISIFGVEWHVWSDLEWLVNGLWCGADLYGVVLANFGGRHGLERNACQAREEKFSYSLLRKTNRMVSQLASIERNACSNELILYTARGKTTKKKEK
jgi:hypothetical protein